MGWWKKVNTECLERKKTEKAGNEKGNQFLLDFPPTNYRRREERCDSFALIGEWQSVSPCSFSPFPSPSTPYQTVVTSCNPPLFFPNALPRKGSCSVRIIMQTFPYPSLARPSPQTRLGVSFPIRMHYSSELKKKHSKNSHAVKPH